MPEAEGGYEAASHQPFEGGDWRRRHPTQMIRPSPIMTFNHKWGHDALEENRVCVRSHPVVGVDVAAPSKSFVVHVGVGGGMC